MSADGHKSRGGPERRQFVYRDDGLTSLYIAQSRDALQRSRETLRATNLRYYAGIWRV